MALPYAGYLTPRPGSGYRQDVDLNPEHCGTERSFVPLTPAIRTNPFLRGLMLLDRTVP